MHILELSGAEAPKVMAQAAFALLPLGSIEYHGPASPVGTDSILAEHFARHLAVRPDCIAYPTVAYTACPGKTRGHAPTLSIPGPIMLAYVTEILRGIVGAGIRHILILNAHDANMGIARAAAEALGEQDGDISVLIVNWWQLASETDTQGLFASESRGHGGAYELSATLAAMRSPGEDWIEPQAQPSDDPGTLRFAPVVPAVLVETKPARWNGYTGCPSEASRDKGTAILAIAQRRLDHLIEQWLEGVRAKEGAPGIPTRP
jgi:creatinine amidohydrolase